MSLVSKIKVEKQKMSQNTPSFLELFNKEKEERKGIVFVTSKEKEDAERVERMTVV